MITNTKILTNTTKKQPITKSIDQIVPSPNPSNQEISNNPYKIEIKEFSLFSVRNEIVAMKNDITNINNTINTLNTSFEELRDLLITVDGIKEDIKIIEEALENHTQALNNILAE